VSSDLKKKFTISFEELVAQSPSAVFYEKLERLRARSIARKRLVEVRGWKEIDSWCKSELRRFR
jgi:hypothetical protein